MRSSTTRRIAAVLAGVGIGWAAVSGARASADDDSVIPILRTKTATYTNVTVTARSEAELCILHAGGAGNLFLEDLEPEALEAVGYVPPMGTGDRLRAIASEGAAEVMKVLPMEGAMGDGAGPLGLEPMSEVTPGMMAGMVVAGLFLHLIYSFCLMLICRKAGSESGLMVWLPVLQVFPMLRAAGMSGWWVFGLLVPVLNLAVMILWCFHIVSARGKSAVWAILLILPLTNVIAFLYLALSSAETAEEETPPRLPAFAFRTI